MASPDHLWGGLDSCSITAPLWPQSLHWMSSVTTALGLRIHISR